MKTIYCVWREIKQTEYLDKLWNRTILGGVGKKYISTSITFTNGKYMCYGFGCEFDTLIEAQKFVDARLALVSDLIVCQSQEQEDKYRLLA